MRPTATPLLRAALAPQRPALWVVGQRRSLCASTVEVAIPELGAESIVEGGILALAKSVGDVVAAEEMIAEIETGTCHAKRKSPQLVAREKKNSPHPT